MDLARYQTEGRRFKSSYLQLLFAKKRENCWAKAQVARAMPLGGSARFDFRRSGLIERCRELPDLVPPRLYIKYKNNKAGRNQEYHLAL